MAKGETQIIRPESIHSKASVGNPEVTFQDVADAIKNSEELPDSYKDSIIEFLWDQLIENSLAIYEVVTNTTPPEWLEKVWPTVQEILKMFL